MSSEKTNITNASEFQEFLKDINSPARKDYKILDARKKYEFPIRDYITMIKEGLIRGYESSRGDANIDPGHVNNIMNKFDVHHFGQIQLSINVNGNFMEITNGNHRTAGILQWFKNGLFDSHTLDSKIEIVTVSEKEKIESYIAVNTQRSLKMRDHYANKDLAFGNIIKNEIFPSLSKDDVEIINNKSFYAPLAYIIYVMNIVRNEGYEVECYQQVYAKRQEIAEKMATKTAEQANLYLNAKEQHRFIVALQYYCDYIRALEKKVNLILEACKRDGIPDSGLKKNKTAFRKSSWFGAIVTDILFNSENNKGMYNFRLSTVRPETLADRCIRKHLDLRDLVPKVTGSTLESVARTLNKIIKILGQPN